jgi:hypothetical protein
MPTRRLSVAVAAVLAVAAGYSGDTRARAQQPAAQRADPQQPPVVIPIGTEVVRVDVIVTDKAGKAVRDLKAQDFQLFEDGQPQPITSFAAYCETPLLGYRPSTGGYRPSACPTSPSTRRS